MLALQVLQQRLMAAAAQTRLQAMLLLHRLSDSSAALR